MKARVVVAIISCSLQVLVLPWPPTAPWNMAAAHGQAWLISDGWSLLCLSVFSVAIRDLGNGGEIGLSYCMPFCMLEKAKTRECVLPQFGRCQAVWRPLLSIGVHPQPQVCLMDALSPAQRFTILAEGHTRDSLSWKDLWWPAQP